VEHINACNESFDLVEESIILGELDAEAAAVAAAVTELI
jgi:hypothetical protein